MNLNHIFKAVVFILILSAQGAKAQDTASSTITACESHYNQCQQKSRKLQEKDLDGALDCIDACNQAYTHCKDEKKKKSKNDKITEALIDISGYSVNCKNVRQKSSPPQGK